MRDPLDLNFLSTGTTIIPSQKLKDCSDKLLTISDFREKLQFYNKHICSLAYNVYEGLHLFGEYSYFNGYGELFFRKADSKNNPHFETYLHERQKEINRLKKLIEQKETYFDKLKCFFENKAGQKRFEDLQIENNEYVKFLAAGAGTVPEHLQDDTNEIDLRPSSSKERKSFNQYLRQTIDELIISPNKFHWLVEIQYKGFLASPAIVEFKKQLRRAFNPISALTTEIKRIEEKFFANTVSNYIEHLYPYNIENRNLWQFALFNAFLNGYEFDYSRKQLSFDEMQIIIHVEHALKYYKQLHDLKKELGNQENIHEVLSQVETKNKLVDHFERELHKGNIPFLDLVNGDPSFKTALLNQYLATETKPCFDFYLADFYSPEELNAGFTQSNKNIPEVRSKETVAASFILQTPFESHINELYQKFTTLIIKRELPEKYYCPDIEKSVIVKVLREIDCELEILKNAVFDESTDKYREPEIRARNIIAASRRLDEFASLTISKIRRDNENIFLHLKNANSEQRRFWTIIKSNFNRFLSDGSVEQIRVGNTDANQNLNDSTAINVFCSAMPLDVPIQHFKVFIENKSKNGKPFLTQEQFDLFMTKAFRGNANISKQTFNLAVKEKSLLIRRFYQFYTLAISEYESTSQCREKYIKLVTDNFSNWLYSDIKNNFSKRPKREL